MPNRREFLQAGIALSLSPLVPRQDLALRRLKPSIWSSSTSDSPRLAISLCRPARPAGLHRHSGRHNGSLLSRPLAALESRAHHDCWASTKASLFCLETLARDRGMRLVYFNGVLDSEPVPDIPLDIADRKSASFSIIGEDSEELAVWVIAPRGPDVRGEGGI